MGRIVVNKNAFIVYVYVKVVILGSLRKVWWSQRLGISVLFCFSRLNSSGCPRQVGLELKEIHLLMPPEC